MFEHFAFGADAPDRSLSDIALSPTDNSFPRPISPQIACSSIDTEMSVAPSKIHEIMCKLRDQTLQPRDELASQPEWTFPAASYGDDDMSFSYTSPRAHCSRSLPNIHLTPGPRTGAIACRRLQRQLNVQLQSSEMHMRDVKALVEEMVMTNSQCVLREASPGLPAPLPTPPPSRAGEPYGMPVDPIPLDERPHTLDENTDEGFHEGEDPLAEEKAEEMFVYRRAAAPGGIRKSTMAAEWARGTDHIVVGGRVLVRSKPRMRKRRTRPPPVSE